MDRKIFVNLPVKNVEATKAFFSSLGFQFNPAFSDANAVCMVVSESNYVMHLSEPFFQGFTPLPISDATKSTEVLVCLSCDSREEVDDLVTKALAAGGSTYKEAVDHGFMYGHGFKDLDGHIWELAYMSGMPSQAC